MYVVILCVVMLSVLMLSVVELNVILLSIAVPILFGSIIGIEIGLEQAPFVFFVFFCI
jgi:hypothetical protein